MNPMMPTAEECWKDRWAATGHCNAAIASAHRRCVTTCLVLLGFAALGCDGSAGAGAGEIVSKDDRHLELDMADLLVAGVAPPVKGQQFGASMALLKEGGGVELILVGAPAALTDKRAGQGCVYVLDATSCAIVTTVVSPDEAIGFGRVIQCNMYTGQEAQVRVVVTAPGSASARGVPGAVMSLDPSDWTTSWTTHLCLDDEDEFGAAVSLTSDWNGNGTADILVGAPSARRQKTVLELLMLEDDDDRDGLVVVLDGASGDVIRTLVGRMRSMGFGCAVVSLADLDGDGVCEMAAGAGTSGRYVAACSSQDGSELWGHDTKSFIEGFGQQLDVHSDIDRDGVADVIAGCNGRHFSPLGQPQVLCLSGRTGRTLWTSAGKVHDESFARNVNVVSDLTGDGIYEVVVPCESYRDAARSIAVVDGATGALVVIIRGGSDCSAEFGASALVVGDADGDGNRKLLVGDPGAADGVGRVAVLSLGRVAGLR